ncbi:MAG: hypothetical protein Q7S29_04680 [Candidatus Peribacter sp.]|nr:hypothetical protein [Candidatus Peribacter sp.]
MSPVVARSHGSQQQTSKKVQCRQCGKMIKAKNFDAHVTKTCPKRDLQARKKLHVKPPAKPQPAPAVHEYVPPRRPSYSPTYRYY